jgi:hypothetical protein
VFLLYALSGPAATLWRRLRGRRTHKPAVG